MKNKIIPPYYTINWDFNRDEICYYNIMPYLCNEWEELKERKKKELKNLKRHKERDLKAEEKCKMPETFEEIKQFILDISRYQFWARCEYEVIVTGWPVSKKEYKLDVYEQIKQNIDVITEHFLTYIKA